MSETKFRKRQVCWRQAEGASIWQADASAYQFKAKAIRSGFIGTAVCGRNRSCRGS